MRRRREVSPITPPTVFTRAGAALHLAGARAADLKEVFSHDRQLLAAASHFGLKGVAEIQ
jgi:hypothetical protein